MFDLCIPMYTKIEHFIFYYYLSFDDIFLRQFLHNED